MQPSTIRPFSTSFTLRYSQDANDAGQDDGDNDEDITIKTTKTLRPIIDIETSKRYMKSKGL